jgi:hypothetical protein
MKFRVEILDTWNMKVEPVNGAFTVKKLTDYVFVDKQERSIDLPGKPWMALRITRSDDK